MMLPAQFLALTLTLAPSLVAAGMFPKDSLVKMLDHKTFKQAMKANVSIYATSASV
jgi:protein disulfide-isomerase A6